MMKIMKRKCKILKLSVGGRIRKVTATFRRAARKSAISRHFNAHE